MIHKILILIFLSSFNELLVFKKKKKNRITNDINPKYRF
jgi:hypothetical protein